jgi:uncharacterized protein (DUF2235 family)
VKAQNRTPLQAAVRLFRQFFDVQGVHQTVDRHQDIRLFVLSINALRYGNNPNARECQALDHSRRLTLIA